MSDDKIVDFPGAPRNGMPVMTADTFKAENAFVAELQELLYKYDGMISNVAMVGTLNTYATLIAIESMSSGD